MGKISIFHVAVGTTTYMMIHSIHAYSQISKKKSRKQRVKGMYHLGCLLEGWVIQTNTRLTF
jgi:hypothetical protein